MGKTTEIEELFNRYDEDMLGDMDYHAMVYHIFTIDHPSHSSRPNRLTGRLLNLMNDLQVNLTSQYGLQGIVNFSKVVLELHDRLANPSSGLTSADHALSSLSPSFVYPISRNTFPEFFEVFCNDEDHTVDLLAFLKVFKGGMDLYRKRLVLAVFDKFNPDSDNYITETDLRRAFRSSSSSSYNTIAGAVVGGGVMGGQCVQADTLIDYMLCVDKVHGRRVNGKVSWSAFLDYYRCISVIMENDQDFEFLLHDSWTIQPSQGLSQQTVRPVPVEEYILSSTSVDRIVKTTTPFSNTRSPKGLRSSSSGSNGSMDHHYLTLVSPKVSGNGGGLRTISSDSTGSGLLAGTTTSGGGCCSSSSRSGVNPVIRRVLVVHRDGSEEVTDVLDDIGTNHWDAPTIITALQAKGVRDIVDVKLRY
eukprot:scaffold227_cov173-Ochromonas_danica.AAC.9